MKTSIDNLKLTGIACCVPQHEVKMSDFHHIFGEKEVNRIVMSTGINALRIAPFGMHASDLCYEASIKLIEALNLDIQSIDAVVFVSQTPNLIMPATSCILHNKLGLKTTALAFDINYGCSGYIYGLFQASILIHSGACNKVLICVGDTISKYLDPEDHKSRLVFGDGGSASIIEKGNDTWTFDIRTDGGGYNNLMIPRESGGNDGYLYMNGAAIMEFALREVKPVIDSVLLEQHKTLDDMSAVVLHQANLFMLQYLRKKLKVNSEIFPIAVNDYGNTGPASIPLALCASYGNKSSALNWSVLSGFGVGLSWGAALINLSDTYISSVYEL